MLLPPFKGASLGAYDKDGNDITSELFAPSGFLKVDADTPANPMRSGRPGTGHIRMNLRGTPTSSHQA
jgi:hypothetical protein